MSSTWSPEAAALHQEHQDRLIAAINPHFAVVTDGPHAGQIVNLASGKLSKPEFINNLFYYETFGPQAVHRWLIDRRRREIGGAELQEIGARYAASKPRKAPPNSNSGSP